MTDRDERQGNTRTPSTKAVKGATARPTPEGTPKAAKVAYEAGRRRRAYSAWDKATCDVLTKEKWLAMRRLFDQQAEEAGGKGLMYVNLTGNAPPMSREAFDALAEAQGL